TIIGRNAFASCSCPSACTVYALFAPHSTPVGKFTFALSIALTTSSMPILRIAIACGSSCTRTAYFCEPYTCTCATPDTVDSRWARYVSAYSSSCDSGRVFDVSARYKMADADGSTFWYDGGMMFCGSWRSVFEIAACTSCAAASMFRSRVNCSTMLVEPWLLLDVITSIPAIVENCFSSGVATAEAIVSGLAPGSAALTLIVG